MKAKLFRSILAATLAGILCFSVAACNDDPVTPSDDGDDNNTQTQPLQTVGVSIAANKNTTITEGTSVAITATVTVRNPASSDVDPSILWTVEDEDGATSDILEVSATGTVSQENDSANNTIRFTETRTVTVKNPVTIDTEVRVVARAKAAPTNKATHILTVRPKIKGQLDDLTAEMLTAVSGDNITFVGTVTNVFETYVPSRRIEDTYYSTVKMEEGGWYGSHYEEGFEDYPMIDHYRMGKDIPSGGHYLTSVIINKDNQVKEVVELGSDSKPHTWESNHYWNHLGSLGAKGIENKFEHEAGSNEYKYIITPSGKYDTEASEDEQLMAYLAWSLVAVNMTTSDNYVRNFVEFSLIVENGKITKILASTEPDVTYGSDDETVTTAAWLEVELDIQDVGTTELPEPEPFAEPENANYLKSAIEQMQTAKNYTFYSVEQVITGSQPDESEYTSATVSSAANVPMATAVGTLDYYTSHVDTQGTVGTVGYVTEDAIVFEKTVQYISSMDDYTYSIGYEGFKKRNDADGKARYDVFEDHLNVNPNNVTVKGLAGVEIRQGDMFENEMPQFDFSPNIFKYDGQLGSIDVIGTDSKKTSCRIHRFVLRNEAGYVTADVVKEIAADSHKNDGEQDPEVPLTIDVLVDGNGNFVSIYRTSYPYAGTYTNTGDTTGKVTTTYVETVTAPGSGAKNYFLTFGSTAHPANAFKEEGGYYIPREWRPTWDKYECSNYNPDHKTRDSEGKAYYGEYVNSVTAFNAIFGDGAVDKLFKPEMLMELIADDVGYPRFQYKQTSTGSYIDYFEIRIAFNDDDPRIDKNGRPRDIEAFMGPDGELTQKMADLGFTYVSDANHSGRPKPTSDFYYATFTKDGIEVVFENNGTKNLSIYFYKEGDWALDLTKW